MQGHFCATWTSMQNEKLKVNRTMTIEYDYAWQDELKCESCDEVTSDVKVIEDPFVKEIYGESLEIALCSECLAIRGDDV